MPPRLRRSSPSGPGIRRRRRGEGFDYVDEDGAPVQDPDVLARIGDLVIPPAWEDVWICPYPQGHLQALGTDQAGRRQYLYHPRWRERRDAQKFEEMLDFARALPDLRARVEADLTASDALTRERVLAAAVRLLDRGFFRIGSEGYAAREEKATYGLATMRKEHVSLGEGGEMTFDFPAKSGKQTVRSVIDPATFDVVARLKRRRSGGEELLAWKEGGAWVDVKSADINAYLKEATGLDVSAKDFRTWNATLLAAVALGTSAAVAGKQGSPTARKRAIARAVKEVAFYLGNTPAVARASYIDPRVLDAFEAGRTLEPVVDELGEDSSDLPIHQQRVEEAVLDLLNAPRARRPVLADAA